MVSTLCLKQCDPPSTPLEKSWLCPCPPFFLLFPSCIFSVLYLVRLYAIMAFSGPARALNTALLPHFFFTTITF